MATTPALLLHFDDETEAVLRDLVADGMTSFKVFLAYEGFFGVTDDELYSTLKLAKELGVVVTAHCENSGLIAAMQRSLLAEGKTGPEWHEPSRPDVVEAAGTGKFATFLEITGAKGYVVHLSNAKALREAVEAKLRGVDISVEAVIPHLVLDKSYAQRPDFEGAKYVMSPPLRTVEDQRALWRGLAAGSSTPSGPTTRRSTSSRRRWAGRRSRRSRTACPRSRTA